MTGRVEPRCRECGTRFDPDTVHDTFLADYLARVGSPHTGRRPAWCRQFCSETCRYSDVRRRAAVANDTVARRKAARRAAARAETDR